MSTLSSKVTKSWTLSNEPEYKTYKGFAIDPSDPNMFNSEAEVDQYRKEALES